MDLTEIGKLIAEYRWIDFFKDGKQVKNVKNLDELFFTISLRNTNKKFGYLKPTKFLSDISKQYLLQDKKYNEHINIIEWDDFFLLRLRDGLYISNYDFFISKENLIDYFKIEV